MIRLSGRDVENLFVYGRVEKSDAVVTLDEIRMVDLIERMAVLPDLIAKEMMRRARIARVGLTPCKR